MKYTTDKKEIAARQQLINDRLASIKWSINDDMARKPLIYLGEVLKEYGDELKDLEKEYEALNRLLKYNKIKWTTHYLVGDEKLGDTVKAEGRYDEINHYTSEVGRIDVFWDRRTYYKVSWVNELGGTHTRNFRSLKDAKCFLIAERPQQSVK